MWKTIFFQDYINIKKEAGCDRASIFLFFGFFAFALAKLKHHEFF